MLRFKEPKHVEDGVGTRFLVEAERARATGDLERAERALRAALEKEPGSLPAVRALVRLLGEMGRGAEALELATRALGEQPRDPELLLEAAWGHEQTGALGEAHACLVAAVEASPQSQEAHRRLASVLGRLGDQAGMATCLRRLITLTQAQDNEVLSALGMALSRLEEHAEAIQLLTEVARRQPHVVSSRADLAMAWLGAGQIDEALAGFSELVRLDPRSAQAHCGIGLVYQRLERWAEAAEAFRATEALAPSEVAGPFNLGLVLTAAGERDEARRALLRAAALSPNDKEIRQALEELLVAAAPAEATAVNARFTGDLKSFALPDVLEFLRLQGKSGSLVLSSRRGAGLVRIARGQITSASVPGIPRLGEVLVARGLIAQSELEAALALQRSGGADSAESLGAVLLRKRPDDHGRLSGVVFEQVIAAVDEMLRWQEGAFSFHPEDERDLPPIAFDLQRVMLEVMRIDDERKHNAVGPKEDR